MKELFGWLNGLEYKTALTTTLMAALTFLDASSALLGVQAIVIINVICGVILLAGRAIAPTGQLPKGWTAFLWITNIGGLLVQVGSFLSDTGLFADAVVKAITSIQIFLNAVIAGVQVYQGQKGSVVK